MEYELKELNKEEADALTKDLEEVLKKHGAEIGVTSNINLMKRVEKGIPTPFMKENGGEEDSEKKVE